MYKLFFLWKALTNCNCRVISSIWIHFVTSFSDTFYWTALCINIIFHFLRDRRPFILYSILYIHKMQMWVFLIQLTWYWRMIGQLVVCWPWRWGSLLPYCLSLGLCCAVYLMDFFPSNKPSQKYYKDKWSNKSIDNIQHSILLYIKCIYTKLSPQIHILISMHLCDETKLLWA